MIIAITGGTGFIGKRLARYHVAKGDTVRVLTRGAGCLTLGGGVNLFQGDLANPDIQLTQFVKDADVLYHCAGEISNERNMQNLHVEGTKKLIKAASTRIGCWVQLSSVGAYGRRLSGTVVDDSPESPVGLYEKTKTLADKLVVEAASQGAFACSVLRPSTVIGNDMPNQSVFQWIGMIQRGLFFFMGKPGALVNYVHVDNVVEALVLCGLDEVARNRVYIVSEACLIERFVEIVCEALGRPVIQLRLPEGPIRALARIGGVLPNFPLSVSRIDALVNRTYYCADRLHNDLHFNPVVPLEIGIRQLVAEWKTRY